MAPLKSPGPDGFAACFYQHHWTTIGKEISDAVLDILSGKGMTSSINSTFIVLISKKDNQELISDFKPIILCNVIYKLVFKVICNRLKSIMPLIIYKIQSTFIPDRLIIDNMIVVYELLHSMKLNKKKKKGAMVVKLNMSKAYDRIEWPYLQAA